MSEAAWTLRCGIYIEQLYMYIPLSTWSMLYVSILPCHAARPLASVVATYWLFSCSIPLCYKGGGYHDSKQVSAIDPGEAPDPACFRSRTSFLSFEAAKETRRWYRVQGSPGDTHLGYVRMHDLHTFHSSNKGYSSLFTAVVKSNSKMPPCMYVGTIDGKRQSNRMR